MSRKNSLASKKRRRIERAQTPPRKHYQDFSIRDLQVRNALARELIQRYPNPVHWIHLDAIKDGKVDFDDLKHAYNQLLEERLKNETTQRIKTSKKES